MRSITLLSACSTLIGFGSCLRVTSDQAQKLSYVTSAQPKSQLKQQPLKRLGVFLLAMSPSVRCRTNRACQSGRPSEFSSMRQDQLIQRLEPQLRQSSFRAPEPSMTAFSFDPFDRDVFRILMDAQKEAKVFQSPTANTDHLLLAATMQNDAVKVALKESGVTEDKVRRHLSGGQSVQGRREQWRFMAGSDEDLLPFGPDCERVLKAAVAKNPKRENLIPWYELLLIILNDKTNDNRALIVLQELGIDKKVVATAVAKGGKGELVGGGGSGGDAVTLEKVATDLTEKAREGALDPVVGRDKEIIRALKILARRRKNNPILLGDPGVGKTAIAEGLAQLIADGKAPERLNNSRIMALELGQLTADTKYRGEFEEKLTKIIEEVTKSDDIILFIDEIHNLVGAGSAEGGIDGANVMKPSLSRGELQVIGATTMNEFRKYFEKDAALERRFQPVRVEEPSVEDSVEILKVLSERYGDYHNVVYSPESLEAAVKLSDRYVPDRFLPDKAIDLLDEAGVSVDLESYLGEDERKTQTVEAEDMAAVVSEWTGIPVSKLTTEESKAMLDLETQLHRRVIGQDFAVSAIARALRRARVGLRSGGRPVASMVFCGPTGVGKTELSKAVAETYYGDENAMVRIDMSEYMDRAAVTRLTGPPPGYVGYEEGGQLTDAVRRNPFTVIVFDEIEKAHKDVFNVLLQVLDDGRLTDNKGRTVDFSNSMIILTSNVGSRRILNLADRGSTTKQQDMRRAVKEELGLSFRPEFLNRLDEVIVFEALTQDEMQSVANLMIKELKGFCVEQDLELSTKPALTKALVKEGYSPKYGARPLRRAVQRMCEDAVAEAVLEGFVNRGEKVELDHDGDNVIVKNAKGKKRTHISAVAQGIEEEFSNADSPLADENVIDTTATALNEIF